MDVFKIKKREQNFLLSKFTKIRMFLFKFMERINSSIRMWLVLTIYLIENDILVKTQNCPSVTVLAELLLQKGICLSG